MSYRDVSAVIEIVDNASPAIFGQEGTIVNLDANFLIPEDMQGVDGAFPRLAQMHEIAELALKKNPNLEYSEEFRRPDYLAEWNDVRKAWALRRANQVKLEAARVHKFSPQYYSDPPENLSDWVWRLSLKVSGPDASVKAKAIISELEKLSGGNETEEFLEYYEAHMSKTRGQRYLSIFKEYFDAYSEFAQVLFLLHGGLDIPDGATASSVNFDRTKMFYGNAFEVLSSSVDLLACLNNLIEGRKFDTFLTMNLADYYKLDKSSRFNPFAKNAAFTDICQEADNQIRNASHHGSFQLDEKSGIISFRSGKGGQGPLQKLSYAQYLAKCCRIFFEINGILELELIMQTTLGTSAPL